MFEAVVQAFPTLNPQEQRVAIMLYRLLAEGGPVAPSALTQVKEWSGMPADQFLLKSNLRSLVEWDHGEMLPTLVFYTELIESKEFGLKKD